MYFIGFLQRGTHEHRREEEQWPVTLGRFVQAEELYLRELKGMEASPIVEDLGKLDGRSARSAADKD